MSATTDHTASRAERVEDALRERDLHALLVTNLPNLRWLTFETVSPSIGLRFADPVDDHALAALVERETARADAS